MAKLRGKHYSLETAQESILKYMDDMFPKQAPHHIVIMSDKDYKKRQEERLNNQFFPITHKKGR